MLEGVRYARSGVLGILLVPFRLGTFVITGSETVVTYDLRPHCLALCTRGLGWLGLIPSLEKVVGSFVDQRLLLLELLPGFVIFNNFLPPPGFPTGKGLSHLPEGLCVYFVPFEFGVIVRL